MVTVAITAFLLFAPTFGAKPSSNSITRMNGDTTFTLTPSRHFSGRGITNPIERAVKESNTRNLPIVAPLVGQIFQLDAPPFTTWWEIQ